MIILLLSQMQASVTAKTTTNPRPIGWQSLKSDNLSLGGYTLARVVKKTALRCEEGSRVYVRMQLANEVLYLEVSDTTFELASLL